MSDELEVIQLDDSEKDELVKIIINSFTKSPQLPHLIEKPDKTGKFIRGLIGLYNSTGKVKMFGIKKEGAFLCSGYCVDSDAKPNFLNLFKFGFNMFILLGFKGLKELLICNKNKPKYEKKCLELMLFGTIDSYQKKGLGKIMLKFLYDYAKKNDYGGVTGVTNKSKPPYSFYKREEWVDDKTFKVNDYEFCWVRKMV